MIEEGSEPGSEFIYREILHLKQVINKPHSDSNVNCPLKEEFGYWRWNSGNAPFRTGDFHWKAEEVKLFRKSLPRRTRMNLPVG